MTLKAYKYTAVVGEDGRVELKVPLPQGAQLEVVVLAEEDDFSDLLAAAVSSMGFWDNPEDDAEWNRGRST
jgi:hypothetical protein